MAKRFTDSDKWRKPWFRSLDMKAKMVWGYLTDNCDHAGIWPGAFDLMSSDVGFKVSAENLRDWFGDKIISFGDRYFLPSYIEFQYGELKEESKPHQSVIKILTKYGFDPKNLTLSKQYPNSMDTIKDKDKEKDKDKDSLRGGVGEIFKPDLESAYSLYPRKEGKARGLALLKASVKTPSDWSDLQTAVLAFRRHLEANKTEAQFIPHFKTWAASWRDWLDPNIGSAQSFSEKAAADEDYARREREIFAGVVND